MIDQDRTAVGFQRSPSTKVGCGVAYTNANSFETSEKQFLKQIAVTSTSSRGDCKKDFASLGLTNVEGSFS
jgi:hypothetical protein